jgi:hypothetical protein
MPVKKRALPSPFLPYWSEVDSPGILEALGKPESIGKKKRRDRLPFPGLHRPASFGYSEYQALREGASLQSFGPSGI